MKESHCKMDFRKLSASKLDTFAGEVKNGIYENSTVFTAPPVTAAEFAEAEFNFSTAAAKFKQYGITEKTSFIAARKALLLLLESLAGYTDTVSNGNVSRIALSGFTPSQEQVKTVPPLDKIEVFVLKRSSKPCEIIVEAPAISDKGLLNYGCLCSEGAPLSDTSFINGQLALNVDSPKVLLDSNRSRRKVFSALIPGMTYYFYVYANNSASVSPLSNGKSIVAY